MEPLSTAAGHSQTWGVPHPFPTARPGFDWLDRAAFAYLALPVLIFLVGWLKWWAGVPLAVLLLVGSRELWSIRSTGGLDRSADHPTCRPFSDRGCRRLVSLGWRGPPLRHLGRSMNWPCAVPSLRSSTARSLPHFGPICAVLLLGVSTAVTEMTRAVAEDAWKPDYARSFVPGPDSEYPPPYATQLTGATIEMFLRPDGNVNELTGTSGPRPPGAAEDAE